MAPANAATLAPISAPNEAAAQGVEAATPPDDPYRDRLPQIGEPPGQDGGGADDRQRRHCHDQAGTGDRKNKLGQTDREPGSRVECLVSRRG
jgi:hypothetical protein